MDKKHLSKIEEALKVKDVLFTISSVAVIILNLWLSSKLAPLAQGIEANRGNISALESDISKVENRCESLNKDLFEEVKYIRSRVDQIHNNTN
jgi:hypothetical protein